MTELTRSRRTIIWLCSGLVSACAVGLLLLSIDSQSFLDRIANARSIPLLVAAAAINTTLFLRALRFHLLLPQRNRGPILSTLRLTSIHQVLFVLLPSGLGDAAFPILSKRLFGFTYSDGIAAISAARLQDLIVLATVVTAALTSFTLPGQPLGIGSIAVLAIGVPIAAYSDAAIAAFIAAVITVAKLFPPRWSNFATRIADKLGHAVAHQRQALNRSGQRRLILVITLASWLFAAATQASVLSAFGERIAPLEALFVVATLNLVGATAVFSLAGLGISEAGLAGTLVFLGYERGEAIEIALIVRPTILLLSIAIPMLVELLCRLLPKHYFSKRRDETVAPPRAPLPEQSES